MPAAKAKSTKRPTPHNPANLASDDGVKEMIASILAGDERSRKRFSITQTKSWALNKAGGGDFIRPIIIRGVAMPAKMVHTKYPPGNCGPEDFYDFRHEPRNGVPWSEVGDLHKLADVAKKTPAANFCEKKWENEARQFQRGGYGMVSGRDNIFTTPQGKRVLKDKGAFFIASAFDVWHLTFATARDTQFPAHIGRVIRAVRKPCNELYDYETLPVREQRLKLSSGLPQKELNREKTKYTERRVHTADVAITIALRH